jgi:uncharacterized membrane protein YkoI
MTRVLITAAMLILMQAAAAQDPEPDTSPPEPPPAAQEEDEARPPGPANLQQAIAIAIKRFGGRAAGAETVTQDDGKRVHEVRVLSDEGRARTVRIDPGTGAIL